MQYKSGPSKYQNDQAFFEQRVNQPHETMCRKGVAQHMRRDFALSRSSPQQDRPEFGQTVGALNAPLCSRRNKKENDGL